MTDNYEQMENDELRRVVAERLGWRFETIVAGRTFGNKEVLEWIAIDPDNGKHRSYSSRAVSQNAAFKKYTPNWPTDVAAALTLWSDDLPFSLHIQEHYLYINTTGSRVDSFRFDQFMPQIVAKALVIARLRWMDAQEESECNSQ